jgi:CRISP-associated protein Cas1
MIKRILYFGNPTYLKVKDSQLIIELPETKQTHKANIEDIGVIMLDHPQITMSQTVLTRLLDNNTAIITCDDKHLPTGMMLPLEGHTLQQARFEAQIQAGEPLKKQLWQQTMQAKIRNQSALLAAVGQENETLEGYAKTVRSGDADNREGAAAAYYWRRIFSATIPHFYRDRVGEPPNHLLNYGYAILRGIVARSLVGSGLLPTFGIHHRNQYNAYCLADDIMEPFRPFVDKLVFDLVAQGDYENTFLDTAQKRVLLGIATVDIQMENKCSPLMVGLQTTTASLAKCFLGETRKIIYPTFIA